MKARHVPERTCVACRLARPKREMTRVVRGVDGTVDVDATGKRSGRGAYVCTRAECWDQALKQRALERALKVQLNEEQRTRLGVIGRERAAATPTSVG